MGQAYEVVGKRLMADDRGNDDRDNHGDTLSTAEGTYLNGVSLVFQNCMIVIWPLTVWATAIIVVVRGGFQGGVIFVEQTLCSGK